MRFVLLACLVAAACATEQPTQGEFTQSVCPTEAPPSYPGFGMAFFLVYCNSCHSETRTGLDRGGAPVTIDFDTEALVRENTSRIDKQAAFGPAARNTLMPPAGEEAPDEAARVRLGEFIACEVAR